MPHHSARIQLCAEAIHDPKHGPAFVSMARHPLPPVPSRTSAISFPRPTPPTMHPPFRPPRAPRRPLQVHNLLAPLAQSSVRHVDVSFGTPPSLRLSEQLDAAIGRTAHISFLENASFLQLFGQTYLEYFV